MQDKLPRIQALSISHAVARLFREQNRLHGRAAQELGLSAEQAHILMVLWRNGAMTMKDLGKEVALSSGTLSTAIDRMEAAELVNRTADPTDRRATRVEPANWPAAKRKKLEAALTATEDDVLRPLDDDERARLLDMLDRVLGALKPPY
jgi:DNA-binding MarR family transcriptional regulator